jgi:nucleoside-diphosphate-sugar epimerase
MKHALIIGISGILGHALAEQLIIKGDWKVSGVARKETPYKLINEKAHLINCDLLNDEEVSSKLPKKVDDVTHIFFAAWVPGKSEEEQCEVNLKFLKNVVETVDLHSKVLKRIYLQTGTKYYGMHVGPKRGQLSPYKESDNRLNIPNFYYDQEDFLVEFSKGKNWTWCVARPPHITGFALHTHMNFGTNLAIYALFLKESGKPLIYPYPEVTFNKIRQFIDARLLVMFVTWMVTHPQTDNQPFNITNGDCFRLSQFWPKMAEYFGMEWCIQEGFDVKNFMKENEGNWEKIQEKYGLAKHSLSEFGDFGFMDLTFNFDWDDLSNISKAREYGFNETVDTVQNFFDLWDELQIKKIIPKQQKLIHPPSHK